MDEARAGASCIHDSKKERPIDRIIRLLEVEEGHRC